MLLIYLVNVESKAACDSGRALIPKAAASALGIKTFGQTAFDKDFNIDSYSQFMDVPRDLLNQKIGEEGDILRHRYQTNNADDKVEICSNPPCWVVPNANILKNTGFFILITYRCCMSGVKDVDVSDIIPLADARRIEHVCNSNIVHVPRPNHRDLPIDFVKTGSKTALAALIDILTIYTQYGITRECDTFVHHLTEGEGVVPYKDMKEKNHWHALDGAERDSVNMRLRNIKAISTAKDHKFRGDFFDIVFAWRTMQTLIGSFGNKLNMVTYQYCKLFPLRAFPSENAHFGQCINISLDQATTNPKLCRKIRFWDDKETISIHELTLLKSMVADIYEWYREEYVGFAMLSETGERWHMSSKYFVNLPSTTMLAMLTEKVSNGYLPFMGHNDMTPEYKKILAESKAGTRSIFQASISQTPAMNDEVDYRRPFDFSAVIRKNKSKEHARPSGLLCNHDYKLSERHAFDKILVERFQDEKKKSLKKGVIKMTQWWWPSQFYSRILTSSLAKKEEDEQKDIADVNKVVEELTSEGTSIDQGIYGNQGTDGNQVAKVTGKEVKRDMKTNKASIKGGSKKNKNEKKSRKEKEDFNASNDGLPLVESERLNESNINLGADDDRNCAKLSQLLHEVEYFNTWGYHIIQGNYLRNYIISFPLLSA